MINSKIHLSGRLTLRFLWIKCFLLCATLLTWETVRASFSDLLTPHPPESFFGPMISGYSRDPLLGLLDNISPKIILRHYSFDSSFTYCFFSFDSSFTYCINSFLSIRFNLANTQLLLALEFWIKHFSS